MLVISLSFWTSNSNFLLFSFIFSFVFSIIYYLPLLSNLFFLREFANKLISVFGILVTYQLLYPLGFSGPANKKVLKRSRHLLLSPLDSRTGTSSNNSWNRDL
jgi:hypothetical protein